jgi:hypothetical protein
LEAFTELACKRGFKALFAKTASDPLRELFGQWQETVSDSSEHAGQFVMNWVRAIPHDGKSVVEL